MGVTPREGHMAIHIRRRELLAALGGAAAWPGGGAGSAAARSDVAHWLALLDEFDFRRCHLFSHFLLHEDLYTYSAATMSCRFWTACRSLSGAKEHWLPYTGTFVAKSKRPLTKTRRNAGAMASSQ